MQNVFCRSTGGRDHSLEIEIADGIGAEIFSDFVHRALVGEKLFGIGKVDAVIAGKFVRRTTDAHVNFLRAGLSQGDYSRAGRRAAHDRVIHDNHAFALHGLHDEIQFHAHIEVANALGGLDEGAADVVIANECRIIGNAEFLGKAKGGIDA